eukprot:765465-Pelagomonas_calceolata.AAC.3
MALSQLLGRGTTAASWAEYSKGLLVLSLMQKLRVGGKGAEVCNRCGATVALVRTRYGLRQLDMTHRHSRTLDSPHSYAILLADPLEQERRHSLCWLDVAMEHALTVAVMDDLDHFLSHHGKAGLVEHVFVLCKASTDGEEVVSSGFASPGKVQH